MPGSIADKKASVVCPIRLQYRCNCPKCNYNFSASVVEHGKDTNCPNCFSLLTLVNPDHEVK